MTWPTICKCSRPHEWNIFLFEVNNRNTRKEHKKSPKKLPEQDHCRLSGVFMVNFKHISHCWIESVFVRFGLNFSRIDRSSRLQMFLKIGALKNFSNFTGKHLCSSLFFFATLLKLDSNICVFLWNLRICFWIDKVKFSESQPSFVFKCFVSYISLYHSH